MLDELASRERQVREDREYAAGIVASAVLNVHRRRGSAPFRPKEFVRKPIKRLAPEEAPAFMHQWAEQVNSQREQN